MNDPLQPEYVTFAQIGEGDVIQSTWTNQRYLVEGVEGSKSGRELLVRAIGNPSGMGEPDTIRWWQFCVHSADTEGGVKLREHEHVRWVRFNGVRGQR